MVEEYKIGEIRTKNELGFTGHGFIFFRWSACADCGKERWVGLKKGEIAFPICVACRNRRTAKTNPHLFHKGEHNGVEFKKGVRAYPEFEWKKGIGYTGDRSFTKDPSFGKKISDTLKRRHIRPTYSFTTENIGGDKHWNWQGGLVPKNQIARSKIEVINWRKSVFKRDDYTCQECGKRGVYICAHHLKSWAKHIELRLDLNNGITLCKECHRERHKKNKVGDTQ